MKTYCNKLKLGAMLGIAALIATSCSKEKEKNAIPSNIDRNVSIRSVRYVDDDDKSITINENKVNGGSSKLAASTKPSGSIVTSDIAAKTTAPFVIKSAAEFDFTTDVSSNAIPQKDQVKASATGRLKAADVPLPNNKKFRLVFVPEGSNTPIYNGVLSAGQDPDLRVAANKKYTWYAFSINDPDTVPNIDGSGNISGFDLANKDFMYASGEITTQEDQNYLDITFLRQMAAIDVTVNTRGLFGGIADNSTFSVGTGSGSSFTNIIQTGTFNIFNSTFANFEDVGPLRGSQMTVVDTRWGNAEKTHRLFTANTTQTISENTLRVRLNSLNITLDDNTIRTFSANATVPIAHATSLNLTKGTLSSTNVRLIESGVTVDGVVWARTNLVYDSNKLYGGSYSAGNSDAYRFRTNNEYARPDINTEYWNFGTSTPGGTDFQTTDACRRVYPEGTWRFPRHNPAPSEIITLSDNTNRTQSRKTVSDGNRYSLIWPGTQAANPAFPDKDLIISAYGFRNNTTGTIEQIPSGSTSGTGLLFTRSNGFSVGANVNYVLYAQVDNGTIGNTDVDLAPHDAGMTIRCVRNIVNN